MSGDGKATRVFRPTGDAAEVGSLIDYGGLGMRVFLIDRDRIADSDGALDTDAFAGDYSIPYEDYTDIDDVLAAGWRL